MTSNAYTVQERPIHSGRKLRVICIGAGASGLLLAYKIQYNFYESDVELQIYEKNPDLGGTWLENRYPGCACDCPAHTYTWSFEPKADWKQTFATSPEIHRYFDEFAAKYDLERHIRYNSQVSGAKWNDEQGKWAVEITQNGKVVHDACDILINASGILNNWRWPAIPGLENFKGPKLHSAAWDETLDLTGKKVGLIGNGSSGIQILPAILPVVDSVVNFIREPTWVSPIPLPGFEAREFSPEEQDEFRTNTAKHLEFHKLVPQWSVGCRRLTPGVGYLDSLAHPKSSVVYGEIMRVTDTGLVMENGEEHPVDVLVCATGFDTTFKPRFPLIGPDGSSLAEKWAAEPLSYLGVGAPGFPNYFMFLGPNCPIGNGPVLIGIETQADYFMKFIQKVREENIKSFNPKEAAVVEFKEHKDTWMKRSVWDQECRSWYKNPAGQVTAVWPGSVPHYIETMERPRFEDYDWNYLTASNRWSFLGNGFSQREALGADLGWYIRQTDDAVPLGKKERFVFTPGTDEHTVPAATTLGAPVNPPVNPRL
ncbi:hypothetical protein Z517_09607 [Fonsecaea pedrosoi CBS 271.37]|uniref:FAD/NAD(P)-binding domain-containing protein n=1 Tax=Fonsecaea pedrosoi CBS 271.37 TaxID=1442368 RepID=A0A0D2DHK5_9EURO|nr:uncharacterized protein Z517_09607 [Fonsecaea pedrosoi CBS 271.37]KIW77161.1 hypothetical protein Z517_09607 [Fonsecaea pedrosoi CBS 271.37]